MDCKKLLACALIICGAVYSHASDEWSYHDDDGHDDHGHGGLGPASWSSLGQCGGMSQSPIDIVPNAEMAFAPWVLSGYDNTALDGPIPVGLTHTGHTLQIGLTGDYLASGGGLPATYQALQAHLHWGSDSTRGSEHTKNGTQYAAELHVVHLDLINNNFDSAVAIEAPRGVAVLGFFIEEGEHNSAWDPVIESIRKTPYPGNSVDFETPFALSSLLASDLSKFARYDGSLTTPGCYESVFWTVFHQTIQLSAEQLEVIRSVSYLTAEEEIEEGHEEKLVDNYRPVQPLNGRTVYAGYISDGPLDLGNSCADRCIQIDVDMSFTCQCNSQCTKYGDCCEDYKDNCLVEVCSYVHSYKNKGRKQLPLETGDVDATR